jgi:phosphotransferase system HPr (HPr) family protein
MTGNSLRHTIAIKNPQGFHMRPIQAFVAVANRFPGTVSVMRVGGDSAVNGKSMLHLMSLGAEQGQEICIELTGPGAAEFLPELLEVFDRNYDDE